LARVGWEGQFFHRRRPTREAPYRNDGVNAPRHPVPTRKRDGSRGANREATTRHGLAPRRLFTSVAKGGERARDHRPDRAPLMLRRNARAALRENPAAGSCSGESRGSVPRDLGAAVRYATALGRVAAPERT
jgi:hypothetical protein